MESHQYYRETDIYALGVMIFYIGKGYLFESSYNGSYDFRDKKILSQFCDKETHIRDPSIKYKYDTTWEVFCGAYDNLYKKMISDKFENRPSGDDLIRRLEEITSDAI